MKTCQQWQESGLYMDKFYRVGDVVEQELYDYLLEVLPPASFGRNHVQCGEPADHKGKDGRPRFTTVARLGEYSPWIYLGDRERGDTSPKLSVTEARIVLGAEMAARPKKPD